MAGIIRAIREWLSRLCCSIFWWSKEKKNGDDEASATKDIREMPGPRCLPVIGTLHAYLPYVGDLIISDLYESSVRKYRKYGPLVRENFFGVNIVHVYDPDDVECVLKHSGKYPERRSHLAMLKYRLSKPETYNDGGMLATNGPEWKSIRSMFQNSVSNPHSVVKYIGITNLLLNEFVRRIESGRANEDDFLGDISRLNLQLLGVITFDVKLEPFSAEGLHEDSMCSQLIEKTQYANNAVFRLDIMPSFTHNSFNPMYEKARQCYEYIEDIATKFIRQKQEEYKDKAFVENESSILERHLCNPEIDMKDIIGVSVDFLMAGFDTTSFTMSFILYHLSSNPEVQRKLYEESVKLLPHAHDEVSKEVLADAVYLKAVMKESLRISPISIGIGRRTTQEMILSGYRIPAGTTIVTNNQISCSMPEYFDDPERFLPERWIKDTPHHRAFHPFLTIPFGNGPRQCIAKRLAEQNMLITVMKLVRNFEMMWVGEPLKMLSLSINMPGGPLRIRFKARC